MEREVDNQVAAPAATRTPNWNRANKTAHRRVRMEGWRQRRHGGEENLVQRKNKTNPLDSDRPSHGRLFHVLTAGQRAKWVWTNIAQGNLSQIRAEYSLPRFELPQPVTVGDSERAGGSFLKVAGVAVAEPCKVRKPSLSQHLQEAVASASNRKRGLTCCIRIDFY